MRVLVTAGNTREKIDQVRDWGNIFTGNTGFTIAKAVADVAAVDLLTSNRQHLAEAGAGLGTNFPLHAFPFTSHAELRDALEALMSRNKYDAIFMTAAVADYSPQRVYAVVHREEGTIPGEEVWTVRDVQAGKVKSNHPAIAVLGTQTEKLVDLFRKKWNHTGLFVKFKLEVGVSVDELLKIGRASRTASDADYLVANTLDMVAGEKAGAYLISETGEKWVPRAELAKTMVGLLPASR